MSKLRTGPIFTQKVLDELTTAIESQDGPEDEHPDVSFERKAHALQKFLQHGMSRFSIDTLQHVLADLIASNTEEEEEEPISIRSLAQLRSAVKKIMMRRDSGSLRASDAQAFKFVENLFYCVYCLSEGKRLFDQLYEDLYMSYSKPMDKSRQSTKMKTTSPGIGPSNHSDNNKLAAAEGDHQYSRFGISTLEEMSGSSQHKLEQTARDVKDVLDRWSSLLTEGELSPGSFDPESEEDLHLLHASVSENWPVLRLVPDMFVKFYKCLELVKQWWRLASNAFPDVPLQRRSSHVTMTTDIPPNSPLRYHGGNDDDVDWGSSQIEEENGKARVGGGEIEAVKESILENENILESLQEEIEALEKREEKIEALKETCDKVGLEIEEKKKRQKRLWLGRGGINANENKETFLSVEKNLGLVESSIKLLEFQHALLFEDFMIHLEIRPSIIRFQDDAKMQLRETQQVIDEHIGKLQELQNQGESSSLSLLLNKHRHATVSSSENPQSFYSFGTNDTMSITSGTTNHSQHQTRYSKSRQEETRGFDDKEIPSKIELAKIRNNTQNKSSSRVLGKTGKIPEVAKKLEAAGKVNDSTAGALKSDISEKRHSVLKRTNDKPVISDHASNSKNVESKTTSTQKKQSESLVDNKHYNPKQFKQSKSREEQINKSLHLQQQQQQQQQGQQKDKSKVRKHSAFDPSGRNKNEIRPNGKIVNAGGTTEPPNINQSNEVTENQRKETNASRNVTSRLLSKKSVSKASILSDSTEKSSFPGSIAKTKTPLASIPPLSTTLQKRTKPK